MDTDNSTNNNSGNNKIVWKRSVPNDTQSPDTNSPAPQTELRNESSGGESKNISRAASELPKDTSPLDLSARAVFYNSEKTATPLEKNERNSIEDLKSEIEQALSGGSALPRTPKANPDNQPIDLEASQSELQKESTHEPLKPPTPQYAPVPEPASPAGSGIDDVTKQNHEALMASLKNDIQEDFEKTKTPPPTPHPQSHPVEQTYYSDLTSAMGSNEPATMSELIQKSRFEEKESRILSPRSRKNIMYIAGTAILLAISITILFLIFGSRSKVEFITEERVDSIIYSNLDTGINVTGLEASRTKQAIRDVIEMKIPEDTVNQIYYVQDDGLGNLSRLGIKDIMRKTETAPPDLLIENIENNFMHGVYRAEKNYPFIVMKATSYDRAFNGMKEWEPTMIDDLASYLDLPNEATDRSLITQGFEDDLIKNKNVRVARFLPRDVDRKGILDFLQFGNSDEEEPAVEGEPTNSEAPLGETIESTGTVSFNDIIFGSKVFAQTINSNPFVTNGAQPTGTTRQCYNDAFPGQVFNASYENQQGYYCVNVTSQGSAISQGTAISQITRTEDVCFDPVYGKRLTVEEQTIIGAGSGTNYGFCFPSYQCKRVACKIGNVEVESSRQGEPGVICGTETTETVSIDADVPKVCRQFNDLLRLDNINNGLLCFSAQGQYLPNYTQSNSAEGVTCISPLSRGARMCVAQNGTIFNPDAGGGIGGGSVGAQFCFEPLNGRMTDLDVNKPCADLTTIEIQQKLAQIGYELRFIATIAQILGFSDNDVQNIREASELLISLSRQNVLQIEEVRQVAAMMQRLERVLDSIDPNLELPITGPNGGLNVYGFLRSLIETVKCTLGIANTLQWITLEQIPQGMIIYSGQTLPQVTPIQQSLVLLGLMDPVSVTGTLDLVTQDAISQLQLANGLQVTGIIDSETALLINNIIENNEALYPQNGIDSNAAIINDYFLTSNGTLDANGNPVAGSGPLSPTGVVTATGLGTYSIAVQNLQIILFSEGYNIPVLNGLFDESTCEALRQYQRDNGLEESSDANCTVTNETFQSLNDLIREKGYLGSGYQLNPQGYLEGVGSLANTFGPGVNYSVNPAEADTLNEGDVVLMYMFLDEETILIARDEIVIEEVINRRVLEDIFK